MYENILPFLEITYHQKEYICIHNRLIPQSTKLFVLCFLKSKYLDLYSLNKIFPKNDSIPVFEGLVSKKMQTVSPLWECKGNKAGPAVLCYCFGPLLWRSMPVDSSVEAGAPYWDADEWESRLKKNIKKIIWKKILLLR